MNVFTKYELISGAAAEVHTVASRSRFEFGSHEIHVKRKFYIERDMNRNKVIKQVSVLKTPNAYRDAGKSTTVRQNKQ